MEKDIIYYAITSLSVIALLKLVISSVAIKLPSYDPRILGVKFGENVLLCLLGFSVMYAIYGHSNIILTFSPYSFALFGFFKYYFRYNASEGTDVDLNLIENHVPSISFLSVIFGLTFYFYFLVLYTAIPSIYTFILYNIALLVGGYLYDKFQRKL